MTTREVRYKSNSPYYGTGLIDGKFLDLLEYRTLPAESDDILKQIGPIYQYRPDLLSYDLYKTTDFWYVFILRNRDLIKDPVWDFTADKKIYIPKLNTVLSNLGR